MEQLDNELYEFLKDFEDNDVPEKETKGSQYLKRIPELTDEVVASLLEKTMSYTPSVAGTVGTDNTLCIELRTSLNDLRSLVFIKSVNRNTCRERSWKRFHAASQDGFESITRVTGSRHLATLLALEAFQYITDITFATESSQGATTKPKVKVSADDLTAIDRRIIHHIGGSVLAKLRKRYRARRKPHQEDCIQLLHGKEPLQEAGLTLALDRGGLKYLTSDSLFIFTELECSFRNVFHGCQPSLCRENFVLDIPGIVSEKYNDVVYEFLPPNDCHDLVMLDIISLFFKIRCHGKLRKIVQAYRTKSKVSKRAKSLRKSVKGE